ncbi:MAG: hypothetical protein AABY22_36475 [Nanoarchaeota archaeon]
MSWSKVENAFWVNKNGKFTHIDIAVCDNCNGIHIPPEKANACQKIVEETYEQVKEKYGT